MGWCNIVVASVVVGVVASSAAFAQTTAGTSATIVVPVVAQTQSFGTEVTVYNPNPSTITVSPVFYDAQNTAVPGPKACTSFSLGANVSKVFSLAAQCALPAGSNFGLLVLTESTGTQRFYGFARTQTPQGVGFSTEGFPIENFNDQVQHATGLKRVVASGGLPTNQTNCFVATLEDAVSYELRLYDGTTNVQLGSTLSGSLAAFQQYRYLDVFELAGVAVGDRTNVRAQFTNVTGNKKKLIGFCTVQENTTFSADFRIAKSYGGTPQNAFVQGGNAFGTTALLGTTDNQPLTLIANNQPVATYFPNVMGPNIVSGYSGNTINPALPGQTIAGGGVSGLCFDPVSASYGSCANQALSDFATLGGGLANRAGQYATVAGGRSNVASGVGSMIGGGIENVASATGATVSGGSRNLAAGFEYNTVGGGTFNSAIGFFSTVSGGGANIASGAHATVAGGVSNTASGIDAFAAGHDVHADMDQCAIFGLWKTSTYTTCNGVSNVFRIGANHGFSVQYFSQRTDGDGTRYVYVGDITPNQTITTWTGAYLSDGGVWVNASDRNQKKDFAPVDAKDILARVAALPVTQWSYRNEPGVRRIGPVAQDFHSAFGLGTNDTTIATGDESGVALAAIQGLHQVITEQQQAIAQQRDEIALLREELNAMKRAVARLGEAGEPILLAP